MKLRWFMNRSILLALTFALVLLLTSTLAMPFPALKLQTTEESIGIRPWLNLAHETNMTPLPLDEIAKLLNGKFLYGNRLAIYLDIQKSSFIAATLVEGDLESLEALTEARFPILSSKSAVVYANNSSYRVSLITIDGSDYVSHWMPRWIAILSNNKGQVLRLVAGYSEYTPTNVDLGKLVNLELKPSDDALGKDEITRFLGRYAKFRSEHGSATRAQVLRHLRLNLDIPYYSRIRVLDDAAADDPLVLVNKFNRLTKDFRPKALVAVDRRFTRNGNYEFLNKDAHEAYVKMRAAARKKGLTLIVASAYRDYNEQAELFNAHSKAMGIAGAHRLSAMAGHSEHQTGLAVDINSASGTFGKSLEFDWLLANAHLYGYILRYPKGKTAITGFSFEPWHWRYVGVATANVMKVKGETLEEYLINVE